MKLIPLSRGKFAKVSDHWFEYLNQWKWYATRDGAGNFYAVRSINQTQKVRMHRVIANTPKGLECDHINHDTLDNQDENLRNCTHAQNGANRNLSVNNTSGYKGVSYNSTEGKWKSSIGIENKIIPIGAFDNAIDAARRYDEKAIELFGEFAKLNFPT